MTMADTMRKNTDAGVRGGAARIRRRSGSPINRRGTPVRCAWRAQSLAVRADAQGRNHSINS